MERPIEGIAVTGEGYVEAPPDTAYLSLGFTATSDSVEAARQEAAEKMNTVLDRLRALGTPERDIRTSYFNVSRDPKRKVFDVTNEVRVTIRDVASSGELLDEAIRAGANSVYGVHFGIEDRDALERQARVKAMANAAEKASELARLAGVRLGPPVYISESPEPVHGHHRYMVMEAAAAYDSTPVEPGEMRVTAAVHVRYSIL